LLDPNPSNRVSVAQIRYHHPYLGGTPEEQEIFFREVNANKLHATFGRSWNENIEVGAGSKFNLRPDVVKDAIMAIDQLHAKKISLKNINHLI
jgi:hypothetical protein